MILSEDDLSAYFIKYILLLLQLKYQFILLLLTFESVPPYRRTV